MSGLESIVAQEHPKQPKPELRPSPDLGAWLHEQGGTLVFSTYQSSRIFFVSANAAGETIALERIVGSAMGMAVDRDKLWISNKEQAWRFANVGPQRLQLNKDEATTDYDAVYMPRWGIFLGGCDTHDLLANVHHAGRQHELLFVNTNYSCIASIDGHYNFVPVWKPPFISALSPEDRCHLNGMGARDGKLAYVTACAETARKFAQHLKSLATTPAIAMFARQVSRFCGLTKSLRRASISACSIRATPLFSLVSKNFPLPS